MYPLHYRLVSFVADYTDDEIQRLNDLWDKKVQIETTITDLKAEAAKNRMQRMQKQGLMDQAFFRRLLPMDAIQIHKEYVTNGIRLLHQPSGTHFNLVDWCNCQERWNIGMGHRILFEMERLLQYNVALCSQRLIRCRLAHSTIWGTSATSSVNQ